jgi:hypothetical protein
MLNAYLAQFEALIQAPSSAFPLIPTAQATVYINAARQQVAAEGECVRAFCHLPTVSNVANYFIDNFVPPSGVGIERVIAPRMGFNPSLMDARPWEWFSTYYFPVVSTGTPTKWALQGSGAPEIGSDVTLWLWPLPTAANDLLFDCACLPVDLVDDTTIEAIPYPFTDAVTFWAAWLGFQSLQRQTDAEAMMQRYQVLMRRARDESTPSVLPGNLPGDIGTKLAAAKTTLTEAQAPAGRG